MHPSRGKIEMIEDMSGGGFERSLRELNFETNDRVPIVGGFICKASFLERITGMRPFWDNPRRIAIEAYRRLGTDLIMQLPHLSGQKIAS